MKNNKSSYGIFWRNFKRYLHGTKENWGNVLWENIPLIPKDYLRVVTLQDNYPFGKKLKLIDRISFGEFGKGV
jgi:hypothetical protein